jgi:hypothetical protein
VLGGFNLARASMLTYILLAIMAAAGYAAAPWWVVLLGVAGIASEGWWAKLPWLHRPGPAWSAKITTYFVSGLLANVGVSALAYGAGRLARAMAG